MGHPITTTTVRAAVAFLLLALFGCSGADAPHPIAPTVGLPSPVGKSDNAVAQRVCAGCHAVPSPAALPRGSWDHVLDWMAPYVGHPSPLSEVVAPQPLLSAEEWSTLRAYYLDAAPEELERISHATLSPLPGALVPVSYPGDVPAAYTLAKIIPGKREIVLGEALRKVVHRVGEQSGGEIVVPGVPVQLALDPSGNRMVLIGEELRPTASRLSGKVTLWDAERATGRLLLDGLDRVTHVSEGDLDGDGRADLVVSEFGVFETGGGLSWYRAEENGRYRRHPLISRPGATKALVVDADRDGLPDVVALMAQAWEQVLLLENRGEGVFEPRPLAQFHSAFGATDLALADFDGDGWDDLLIANGDLGDYPLGRAPRKPYQGVRILINDGSWNFEERYFFPMPGVLRAVAADLNGDGRPDVAAAGSLTRLEDRSELVGFVLLMQGADLQFTTHALSAEQHDSFLALDVADFEGDGDLDLVLGGDCPPGARGAGLLFIENIRN